MTVDVGSKSLPIIDYGYIAGPKRELAVRLLTDEVRAAGDTMVLGSMQVRRNRFRGQWRPGWVAKCRAIKDGQVYGLGLVYEVVSRSEQQRRMYQRSFDWGILS